MSASETRQDEGMLNPLDQAELSIGTPLCEPQANSTVLETVQLDSGFVTESHGATNFALEENVEISEKNGNGPGIVELEETVVESSSIKGALASIEVVKEKRQPKLTEKGKAYRLSQNISERKKLKREIQTQIANIETLMGLDKNVELVSAETLKLNECFKVFGYLHEGIQELLTEDERVFDSYLYSDMEQEVFFLREGVKEWMTNVSKRIRQDETDKLSTKLSIKSKSSKSARVSTTSSKARALEARAKHAALEAKIAQLDRVETARKEAERAKLMAECAAAAAVSKVYEDAVKEDDEQYLGSDDPDNDDKVVHCSSVKKKLPGFEIQDSPKKKEELKVQTAAAVDLTKQADPTGKQSTATLNPDAREFVVPFSTSQHVVNNASVGAMNPVIAEREVGTTTRFKQEPQPSFWERMELRMSRPPPTPAPFDGDPAQYLRFRANFKDQVESKLSLSDSEKMNYLLTYTTGRARKVIETYQGLPNGCQLALQVLKQRFGQNAMVVEALKSSVIRGPRIKDGDSEGLLALSDKIQNCCWAMIELQSGELDCTTNLKQIYDRLPDHLKSKWRKTARLYRDRNGGRESVLSELSRFISTESLTENDPVYGKHGSTVKSKGDNLKKPAFHPRTVKSASIATLTTDINKRNEVTRKAPDVGEVCKVCKRPHKIPKCSVFLSKSVSWRRWFAKFNTLCYRCLSSSHLQRECPERNGCTEKDCTHPLNHHSLLHVPVVTPNQISEDGRNVEQSPRGTDLPVHKATTADCERGFVLLKVVPLCVVSENGTVVSTYGLLDTAAVSSMITSNLATRLQLQGVPERVSINTVTNKSHDCELSKVKFMITPISQDGLCLPVHHGLTVEDLNVSDRYCPNQLDLSEWPHLKELELPCVSVDVDEVSVLIGQDVPQAHIVLDYCWGDNPQSQPYGTKTPFGWCVAGPTNRKEDSSKPVALSVFEFDWAKDKPVMNLNQQVEKFWASESYGFGNSSDGSNSIEDDRAQEILHATTRLRDGRYEVGLLWRNRNVALPNNRPQAERRLQQLKKRFLRDQAFADQYRAVMSDYIDKGYAVKLSNKEAASTSNHTWYLPHHGVINPNKSKVRVVYDAAAEYSGTSLNKELLQGPQLTNSLIGVLFRFRKEEVAVASDIESMFHRVACTAEDTDALRFLWWSEGMDEPPIDHKMTVHLFGKADSPCIAAWALKRTATDNAVEFGKVCDIVTKNFYVDDCLFSVPTTEQAVRTSLQLMQLLQRGNFRLTKFVSNDKDVLAAIPAEERTVKDLDLDKLPIERTLGLQWDTETDCLAVKVSLSPKQLSDDTRRGCLSTLSSTFDPLGLIGPVLLPAKRVMQKTWQLKLSWDEQLPEDLLKGWQKWKEDLALLSHVSIPRCYFRGGCSLDASFQLHHFSDASEYGYGTVSYLRKETKDGTVNCSFIMAKSRTAPLQYVSVPRLELQAATIAARVHRSVLNELDLEISSTFFWTDSKVTLQYIKNVSRRFKTYVANRVSEIRDVSHPSQWRHCPGSVNPADDASCGLTTHQLLSSERWFGGPAFLLSPEEEWPRIAVETLAEDDLEVKTEKPIFMLTEPDKLQELLERYSSWTVLQRKVAWLLKFKTYLKCQRESDIPSVAKYLTTDELKHSTIAIVKLAQKQVYSEEIKDLEKRGNVKSTSKLVKLKPVLDNGVMRVGGRILEAPIGPEAKFPMIVPPKHHVARLLITAYHQKLAHAGQNHILAQLREQFWIPKGRSAVRRVVRSCLLCKKQRAAKMEQMMAALPAFRTTAYEPCFTHTGVDYFGPLNVKRGRAVVKRWGVIFTCLNSRAVHLELASSLESDCFINVLRRFISRRGPPKFIHSDNGTNFVGAEREIRESIQTWNQKQIQDQLLQKGCQWVFQPPKASHASGVWERLIRSTRVALRAILGNSLVDEEVMATVLTEVESILNSRPICSASDDPNYFAPLTPNHLLLQRAIHTLPPGSFVKEDIFSRRKWKQTQILADHFWKRWLKEYIPSLQERQKWYRPHRNAEVGDLVLLVDECLPRGQWRMGRIVKLFPSRDGLIRTVEVKTGALTSFVRPVQKLCLLEESGNLYC